MVHPIDNAFAQPLDVTTVKELMVQGAQNNPFAAMALYGDLLDLLTDPVFGDSKPSEPSR